MRQDQIKAYELRGMEAIQSQASGSHARESAGSRLGHTAFLARGGDSHRRNNVVQRIKRITLTCA
jgi:hypothetical protein